MASVSKLMQLPGVSVRSFFLTFLVIALVVALFFIPEIIDFQKSLGSSNLTTASEQGNKENVPMQEASIENTSVSLSPLERINSLISHGYVEQLTAKKVVGSRKNEPANAGDGARELSWELIKSKPSVTALKNAEREALTISRGLGADKVGTRYALFSFVSGTRLLTDGSGERAMSAQEAVRYLEYLFIGAGNAMQREGVDRAEYNRWASLTLGPAFETAKTARVALQKAPFNPHLTLTGVRVYKPGDRRGQWLEQGRVYVAMQGYVVGSDIKSIQVFLNGNRLGNAGLQQPQANGRRSFSTPQWNGRGVYTFKVTDKAGQEYEKSYSFYPRVRKFPWRQGPYEIPYGGEKDLRLDRFFVFKGGSSSNSFDSQIEGNLVGGNNFGKF